MLERLLIQDLITIEKQIIQFQDGFSVITGETGTGKSVLLKALNLVLGDKGSKNLIRPSAKSLLVEGVFSVGDDPIIQQTLQKLGYEGENLLVLRRKINSSGKNLIYINDSVSGLNTLAQVGELLVDFHGQHAQQTLLKPANHLGFLDEFAGISDNVKNFREVFLNYSQRKRDQENIEKNTSERARQIDFIQFQLEEIDQANLSEEEEQKLQEECIQLSNYERLKNLIGPLAVWGNMEDSPLFQISWGLQQLSKASELDSKLQTTLETFQAGFVSLEESIADLERYLGNLDAEPGRLDWINSKLAEIEKLKRKYGETIPDIFSYQQDLDEELRQLEKIEHSTHTLDQEIAQLHTYLKEQSVQLSELRRKNANILQEKVRMELKQLGMKGVRFQINVSVLEDGVFNSTGSNQVEFLISTNPNGSLEPIHKIVSGGELSRIMLAFKTVLNDIRYSNTMIFDEIDSGISGRVAETVGQKMKNLSQRNQIVCITHLPQIAALAQNHYKVEKQVDKKEATTTISLLDHRQRVDEISRFMGGNQITEATISAAEEMLGAS